MHTDLTTLIESGQFVCLREFSGYAVSTDGRIWSCWTQGRGPKSLSCDKWRCLKPSLDGKGYFHTTLTKDRKIKDVRIHRIILEAFCGFPDKPSLCLHANGDKKDNRLSNLRWGNHSENAKDSMYHGTWPTNEKHYLCKISDEKANEIIRRRLGGEKLKSLCKEFRVSKGYVSMLVSRKTRRHLQLLDNITIPKKSC